ncbi:hypothetical protein E2C01_076582 [Portunus trituberculatus]|uniref:Uncharacterized protein n=1 Tax=Portunus trituberculatus TaxID=210409 RepID=A0A5B7I925_PORTR|nr:hypothetical protein [Portunus trituberculatus]
MRSSIPCGSLLITKCTALPSQLTLSVLNLQYSGTQTETLTDKRTANQPNRKPDSQIDR